MGSIVSLTVLFCIYAVSELIAMRTRAILSTVLGISVILLAGFWSGILPQSIIKDAQGFGHWHGGGGDADRLHGDHH